MNSVNQSRRRKNALQRKRAYRHSRSIWYLKIILPITAIILLSWILLFSWLRIRSLSTVPTDFLQDNLGHMIMRKVVISDYDHNSIKYFLSAESAQSEIGNQNIFLKDFIFTMPTHGFGSIRIVAHSANLSPGRRILNIEQPFRVTIQDNTQENFKDASIDMEKSTVRSLYSGVVTNPSLVISAQSSKISLNDQIMVFSGRVSVKIKPAVLQRKDQ
ncbi:MAG: hypothetical protein EU981_01010 [Candidatus Liberibacter ctenarytainae]|uniref:LPS export ABC transporter periplasmic protein LptC n=1 Tax=Candidatus Liberibacter ctenarytainae TaxID=2020335 RepID=A0A937ARE7_9HYPH|nr:hypothetical protein [Candidatus Liberibacter ctenarytainae]